MPHVQQHSPGSFNWLELGTTDQKAAQEFYGQLLGWQPRDFPMRRNFNYTMFLLNGRMVSGCYPIQQGQPASPHWDLYVAVDNADETAARAAELGGVVLQPPADVVTFGRKAVIQDPTGAVFSVWQAKEHIGVRIAGEHGALCWADLNTPGRLRAKEFYEALFGWQLVPGKDKTVDSYLHIVNGEAYIGGILPDSQRDKNAPPHWLIYFQVTDCDASTAKAQELGAQVHMPPVSIENAVRYSVLADPQGAVFALFTGRV